jgi:hypothetical protein
MLSKPSTSRRTEGVILALIVALALLVRVGVIHRFQGFDAPPKAEANPDQIDYEGFASRLAAGRGYCLESGQPTACRPPGTSFTLAPVYMLFGHSYSVARAWFCLLSTGTVAATWWLARRAFGVWSGLAAALMLALYPGHFYYAMHFLSEVPFALGVALATGLGLVAARPGGSWRAATGCGAAWGFTILVRPNMLLGVALAGLALLLAPGSWARRLGRSAIVVGAAALVLTPWVARNARVVGKAAVCTIVGGYTFWGAHNPLVVTDPEMMGSWVATSRLVDAGHALDGDESHRESQAWAYGLSFVREHREMLPRLEFHKVMRLFWPYRESEIAMVNRAFRLGWLAIAPFVAIGMISALRKSAPEVAVLLVPVVATLLTAVIFYGSNRFRDGIAPILVAFAGFGLVRAFGRTTVPGDPGPGRPPGSGPTL